MIVVSFCGIVAFAPQVVDIIVVKRFYTQFHDTGFNSYRITFTGLLLPDTGYVVQIHDTVVLCCSTDPFSWGKLSLLWRWRGITPLHNTYHIELIHSCSMASLLEITCDSFATGPRAFFYMPAKWIENWRQIDFWGFFTQYHPLLQF